MPKKTKPAPITPAAAVLRHAATPPGLRRSNLAVSIAAALDGNHQPFFLPPRCRP